MSTFIPAPVPAFRICCREDAASSCIVLFCGQELCLPPEGLPEIPEELTGQALLHIGTLNGRTCYALETAEKTVAEKEHWQPVRIVAGRLSDGSFTAVCRAKELLHWRKQHKFCGRCGALLKEPELDAALSCPVCGELYYPQLAPAVIVAVIRNGEEILLAHHRRFQEKIYGLIAGFIEAGESAEQAILREIREETGITVGNIRYFSSQCWPFPNSLMLGYYADYVSGDAAADGVELTHADWFKIDALPQIPPPGSIARRLIDNFILSRKQGQKV